MNNADESKNSDFEDFQKNFVKFCYNNFFFLLNRSGGEENSNRLGGGVVVLGRDGEGI